MIRYTKCVFYFAGATQHEAVQFCKRYLEAFEGWTLQEAIGGWKGETEPSWILTIILPTDTPAHIAQNWLLMPATENSVETEARTIAENLTLEFEQEAVAYELTPVQFALTTSQARYKRNG